MTSATVRVAGPLTIASAKGSHADIASVTVTVAGENALGNHQDPLASGRPRRVRRTGFGPEPCPDSPSARS